MSQIPLLFSLLVQAIALGLFVAAAMSFVNLMRGCFLLRRMALAGRQDYGPVLLKSPMVPAVSTIATPPDASAESLLFTRRLLDLHFGRNEVVIVLDGPSAEEMEIWTRELRLCPSTRGIDQKLPTQPLRGVYESRDPVRVVVIDKEYGGPVDAWNAGVNASTSPVIGLLEPASEFVPDVLLRLIQPMLESADDTIAVSGGVSAPPGDGLASKIGALESLRAWLTRGAAFAGRGTTMPFPGSALLVKRSAILQAGGFTAGPFELFLRLHGVALAAGKPYRITFLPDRLCHSRTARTFGELRQSVEKDQQELAAAFSHRVKLAGPSGGKILKGLYFGRRIRPILEMLAYLLAIVGLVLGWVDVYTVLLVLVSTVGMGIVVSMAAVVLREVAEPARAGDGRFAGMFFAAVPENLIYRLRRNLWLITGFRKSPAPQKQNRGSAPQSAPPAVSATSA
jgi:hypothetical protein